jgi:tyrosyl-tRNA synthetase
MSAVKNVVSASRLEIIIAGTQHIIPLEELKKKLTKKELIIKLGIDPSSPNIHLGHAVVLEKLKDFQKLGYTIVLLVGSFTGKIGDPTGKSKTRKPLTDQDINDNIRLYKEQIGKTLSLEHLTIVYNGDWFSSMTLNDFIHLASKVTLSQITERDDFNKRLRANEPIHLHEIMYPLLQGYDSIALNADIEIGGTDQMFNMLMGRQLQEAYGKEKQVIITMPIIEGTDGKQKMSKSLRNDISFLDDASTAFSKIMSISDELMDRYYRIILRVQKKDIDFCKEKYGLIEAKKILAKGIVAKYWSSQEAEKAYIHFTNVVQRKDYTLDNQIEEKSFSQEKEYKLIDVIHSVYKEIFSRSKIRILLSQGAIVIANKKVTDQNYRLDKTSDQYVVRVGKKYLFKLRFIKK